MVTLAPMVILLDYPNTDSSPSPSQANVHIWPKMLRMDEEGPGHAATMGRSAVVKPALVPPEEVLMDAEADTPAMAFAAGESVIVKDVADVLYTVGSTPYFGTIHIQAHLLQKHDWTACLGDIHDLTKANKGAEQGGPQDAARQSGPQIPVSKQTTAMNRLFRRPMFAHA